LPPFITVKPKTLAVPGTDISASRLKLDNVINDDLYEGSHPVIGTVVVVVVVGASVVVVVVGASVVVVVVVGAAVVVVVVGPAVVVVVVVGAAVVVVVVVGGIEIPKLNSQFTSPNGPTLSGPCL
jgi:hypothetical protein